MRKLRNVAEKVKEVIKIHYGIGDENLAMWASSIIVPCFYIFTGIIFASILILIQFWNMDVSNIHWGAIENLSLLDMACTKIFAVSATIVIILCANYKYFDHMFIAEQCNFFSRLSLRSYPIYVILIDVFHILAFTLLTDLVLILFNLSDSIYDLLIKLRYLFLALTGFFFFLYCIIALLLPTKQEKQEKEYFFGDDEYFFDDDDFFDDEDEDFFEEDEASFEENDFFL